MNKSLVEYPSATFAGVLMKRKNISKNTLLNPRSSAETNESYLAEELLFFCNGSETALTSQKCEVKDHILVIDSGPSSHMFFDRSLFFNFSEETQRKVKIANGTFCKLSVFVTTRSRSGFHLLWRNTAIHTRKRTRQSYATLSKLYLMPYLLSEQQHELSLTEAQRRLFKNDLDKRKFPV